MDAEKTYALWLDCLDRSDPMYQELEDIKDNKKEITDRFYQEISFGTAGLRGICGAGTNRMNRLTVGRATLGISEYLLSSGEDVKRGAVIAYDCRYHSKEFSELAAGILMAAGIPVYLFPSLRPTPELSFAIRSLGALSGINMTASHNPKEYNGYKVYWKDGAQISGKVAAGMQERILSHSFFDSIPQLSLGEGREKGLLTMLGEEMDRKYLDYVLSNTLHGGSEIDLSVPIVYTPLNGAGSIPFARVMAERGFTDFHIVPEQKDPDPEFSTVGYPNPEDPKAFALAEKLGREKGAGVLIATDPDSDRMAVELSDGKGGYVPLNGNQTGALLIAYKAASLKGKELLPEKSFMVKSIVTGDFGKTICEDYGISVFEALTGFPNICGRIPELEERGYSYFFAYEESIGCAPGEAVRDKDGITAGMLIAEMAAYFRKQGISLQQYLESLYNRYGFFAEDQVSLILKGEEGQRKIGKIMDTFRGEGLQQFGRFKVESVTDYLHGCGDIPASNVLRYHIDADTWFAMRPSGTEPKLKFYYYTRTGSREESEKKLALLKEAVEEKVSEVL